jgi:hypothetical protein
MTSGTTMIAAVSTGVNPTETVTGVADNLGNNFVQLLQTPFNAFGTLSLWALNTPAAQVGAKPTITATKSSNGYGMMMLVQEVPSIATGTTIATLCDGTPLYNQSATASFTTVDVPYSSTVSGEYTVSIYGDDGNANSGIGISSPWTADPNSKGSGDAVSSGPSGGTAPNAIGIAYKNSVGGSESPNKWTISNVEDWNQICVSFKLPGGPVTVTGVVAMSATTTLTATAPSNIAGAVAETATSTLVVAGTGYAGTLTAPGYAGAAADMANGIGVWVNPTNADGTPDAAYATWGVPSFVPFAASVSSNGRNVLDQNGNPWLMVGDTAFDVAVNLTTIADWDLYINTRAAQGFNAIYMNIIAGTYDGAQATWKTLDGVSPFFLPDGVTPGSGPAAGINQGGSTDYDITKPNPTYFGRIDTIIAKAKAQGMTVFLNPADAAVVDQPDNSGWIHAQGTTRQTAYGQFLGNRYKNSGNVQFQHGNDYGLSGTSWSLDADLGAIANGIRSVFPAGLQAIELNFNYSTGFDNANWRPGAAEPMDLNAVYEYAVIYDGVLKAYHQQTITGGSNSSPVKPVYLVEAVYENPTFVVYDTGTPANIRGICYFTLCCGGIGGWYGNGDVFQFNSSWKTSISHTGATQIQYVAAPFRANNWQNLVPDGATPNLLSSQPTAYPSNVTTQGITSLAWAAAAVTPVGDFGVVYTPVVQALTIAMTKMRGTTLARWYDPTNGTYVTIGSYPNTGTQIFTPTGNNSAGDHDWLLVLTA